MTVVQTIVWDFIVGLGLKTLDAVAQWPAILFNSQKKSATLIPEVEIVHILTLLHAVSNSNHL